MCGGHTGLPLSRISSQGSRSGSDWVVEYCFFYTVGERRRLLQLSGAAASFTDLLSNAGGLANLVDEKLSGRGITVPAQLDSGSAITETVSYDPTTETAPWEQDSSTGSFGSADYESYGSEDGSYGSEGDGHGGGGDGSENDGSDEGSVEEAERTYEMRSYVPVVSFKMSFGGLTQNLLLQTPNAGAAFCSFYRYPLKLSSCRPVTRPHNTVKAWMRPQGRAYLQPRTVSC